MFVNLIEDMGECPFRLTISCLSHTNFPPMLRKPALKETYLVDAIRIPGSLEMVFEPQRDSLHHSLKRVQSLLGRPIDLSVRCWQAMEFLSSTHVSGVSHKVNLYVLCL